MCHDLMNLYCLSASTHDVTMSFNTISLFMEYVWTAQCNYISKTIKAQMIKNND